MSAESKGRAVSKGQEVPACWEIFGEQWGWKELLSGLGDEVREVLEGANYGGTKWGATEEF